MLTSIFKAKLTDGSLFEFSKFSNQNQQDLLFVHSEFLSSERPITNTTYYTYGNSLFLINKEATTTMVFAFNEELNDLNDCISALESIGIKEQKNKSLEVKSEEKVIGDFSFFTSLDDTVKIANTSFSYSFSLHRAGINLIEHQGGNSTYLEIWSHNNNTYKNYANFSFHHKEKEALTIFWKKLRFLSHL